MAPVAAKSRRLITASIPEVGRERSIGLATGSPLRVTEPPRISVREPSAGSVPRILGSRRRAFQSGRFSGAAAVDPVFFHRRGADGASRVDRRHIGRLVRVAELRRPLELIEESTPGGPEPRLAVPWRLMPESSFSFAHKQNHSRFH